MQQSGLNDEQVLESLKKYGNNKISNRKQNSFFSLLLESLADPIIKILLIALGIKVVFLFQDFDWFETLGILIAIFIASFISSISEYGSLLAFKKLEEQADEIKVNVIRNSCIKQIHIDDVVVGDIIYLNEGDKIAADGILIEGSIDVDESVLNGESASSEKNPNKDNQLYRGSVVESKQGIMLTQKVGDATMYGTLALEIQQNQPESPLKARLRGVAKFISKIGYIGAILVFLSYLFSAIVIQNNFNLTLILNSLKNYPLLLDYLIYALTLSVTIIVVAVPEGLPMMITLVLSSNMKRLLKRNVLVRKLVGIETSGSLNTLMFDKTGTITSGKLEVTSLISGDEARYNTHLEIDKYPSFAYLVDLSLSVNNASLLDENNNIISGNSTDKALLRFSNKKFKNIKILDKIPFNSTNKYALTTIMLDKKICLLKGAPEKILPHCSYYYDKFGKKRILTNKDKLQKIIEAQTSLGQRLLILAINDQVIADNYFHNLTLVGIVSIKDELRDDALDGLLRIQRAHIQTIMITGDAKKTAIAIAREAKMYQKDDIVLTSQDLSMLSDKEIIEIFPKIKIVARAKPSDKSRLVKIAQSMNLVVGMSGDGVNDAPALKLSDVGFAMGSGSEVAKAASDIVILDDSINSISHAILFGRTIFKSIRKFIIFQLTVNICAVVMAIIGPFIGIETPITIVQMLWINMIMDTLAGIAFSYEPPLDEYMDELPKRKNEPIINKYMYSQIFITGLYSAILCLVFLKLPVIKMFVRTTQNSKFLMTAYFALFIFMSIFNAFNARTQRINLLANLKDNKVFLIIFGIIVVVQIYLIYYGGNLFRTYGLNLEEFIFVTILAFSVIPVDIIRKLILRKLNKSYSI